jgi:hypothetical protein
MKILLLLAMLFAACIPGEITYSTSSEPAGQSSGFIKVDGPDLKSRLEIAVKQGRGQQKRFWTAYTFDVRPGIAFDAMIIGAGGSRTVINGSMVSSRHETRNVGIFLLHEEGGRSIVRAEIYNLERTREYAGYPVYWLGRGGNEESLNILRSLIGTVGSIEAAERLTDAIGAHDDPRVAAILKDLIRNSKVEKVRTTAVSWLGHLPGETPFLATLVRDEREGVEVRKEAAEAIGDSPDGDALVLLQNLYRSVSHREVRREILDAIADERTEERAVDFLIEIAEREPESSGFGEDRQRPCRRT